MEVLNKAEVPKEFVKDPTPQEPLEIIQGAKKEKMLISQEELEGRINLLLKMSDKIPKEIKGFLNPKELAILQEELPPKALSMTEKVFQVFPELKGRLSIERPEENKERLEGKEELEKYGLEYAEANTSWVHHRGDKIVMVMNKDHEQLADTFKKILEYNSDFLPPNFKKPDFKTDKDVITFSFYHELGHVLQIINGESAVPLKLFPKIDTDKYKEQARFMRNMDIISKLSPETEQEAEEISNFLNSSGYGMFIEPEMRKGESQDQLRERVLEKHFPNDNNQRRDVIRLFEISEKSGIAIDELLSTKRGDFTYRLEPEEFEADEFAIRMMANSN